MADRLHDLWVWMNGEHIGSWQRGRTVAHRFTYEPTWLQSPRGPTPFAVHAHYAGPDSHWRIRRTLLR